MELAPDQGLEVGQGIMPSPVQDQGPLRGVHGPDEDPQLGEEGVDQGLLHRPAARLDRQLALQGRRQVIFRRQLLDAPLRQQGEGPGLKQPGRHGRDPGVQIGLMRRELHDRGIIPRLMLTLLVRVSPSADGGDHRTQDSGSGPSSAKSTSLRRDAGAPGPGAGSTGGMRPRPPAALFSVSRQQEIKGRHQGILFAFLGQVAQLDMTLIVTAL